MSALGPARARAFSPPSRARRPVAIATYVERLLSGERGAQLSRATRLIGKGPAGAAEAEEASTTAVRGRVLVVGLDGAGKTSIVQLLAAPERRARARPRRAARRAPSCVAPPRLGRARQPARPRPRLFPRPAALARAHALFSSRPAAHRLSLRHI